jgi:lysylphosphatidylglycerol synthase-like protein
MTPGARRHAAHEGRRWQRPSFEIFLFVTGSGLFAALIWTMGFAPIAKSLTRLGPTLGLVVGVEVFAIVANTLSWHYTFDRERRGDVPFTRLMSARIVGDALNYVIAGAGEISKIRLLFPFTTVESALASVALAKVTEGIALGLFGLLGVVATWPLVVASPASAVSIAVAVLGGAGLVAGSLGAIRFGLVPAAVHLFRHLRSERTADSRLESAATAASPQSGRTASATLSTIWDLVGWLVNVVELWLACHFLGLRPSPTVVFAGEALGALSDAVFFFVPLNTGAAEGGRVFVFTILGLGGTQGLMLALIRRVRELTWTAVGLLIYPCLGMRVAFEHREIESALEPPG